MENALAAPQEKTVARKPIKDLLTSDQFRAAVAAALPKHLKVDRFIRVALNATMRQPDLLSCSQESFFRAMLDLSTYGLEPDGRRAHLIPFRNTKTGGKDVQLIIDYKGLAELVRRSGEVSYMHADVVYAGDDFDYAYGSGAFLRHKPRFEERGSKVVAVYSFVKLRDGNDDFIVLSPSEVETVRLRSRAATDGPWKTDWNEMAKKTAFRRQTKWLPLSPEVRDAIERDDEVIDASGLDVSDRIHTSVSLEQIRPSKTPNRGHDHVMPEGIVERVEITDESLREPVDSGSQDEPHEGKGTGKPTFIQELHAAQKAVGDGAFWAAMGRAGYERIDDVPDAVVAGDVIAEALSAATETKGKKKNVTTKD